MFAAECRDFAVASAQLGDYRAAFEWCLKGQQTEDTADAVFRNRRQRQRRGIHDPCLKTITASAIDSLANDPNNLELQCLAALCFWFTPAIGAALVAEIILQQIDTTAPGRLGLLADNVTKQFNAELRANGLDCDVKNPWPPGQPASPFGRLVRVIDMRRSWKPEDLN